MLGEADKLLLDGKRGVVTVATAKWGFEGRNETEISFAAGAEIQVFDEHESGWWTGCYNGCTGFFPANRTTARQVNLQTYQDSARLQYTSPMFAKVGEAPALPSPMVKAGKMLGISEKEAEALSPKGRQDRSVSLGNREETSSPRKALSVMGFEDEAKSRSSFSGGLSRMTRSVTGSIRRIKGATPERKNSTTERAGSGDLRTRSPRSPRSKSIEENTANRGAVKFAETLTKSSVSGESSDVGTETGNEMPLVIDQVAEIALLPDDDSWGDDEVDESNLIY